MFVEFEMRLMTELRRPMDWLWQ